MSGLNSVRWFQSFFHWNRGFISHPVHMDWGNAMLDCLPLASGLEPLQLDRIRPPWTPTSSLCRTGFVLLKGGDAGVLGCVLQIGSCQLVGVNSLHRELGYLNLC